MIHYTLRWLHRKVSFSSLHVYVQSVTEPFEKSVGIVFKKMWMLGKSSVQVLHPSPFDIDTETGHYSMFTFYVCSICR